MKLDKQTAIKLYSESPKWFQKELENEFGIDFYKVFDYTDIKTFEDACEKLGINPSNDLKLLEKLSLNNKSIIANYKLCIIYKVINNGWVPDYTNPNQYKYYPYFKVLPSGLHFSNADYIYGGANANVGVRLCTDTAAKAEYIGKQFKDIYQDYLL